MTILALSTPVLAIYMPEILLIIDFGGLELAVSFIILYFKPIILKYKQFLSSLKTTIKIFRGNFQNSVLIQSKYCIFHKLLSVFIMFISGSIALSFSVFLPAIYLGGVNS